MKITDILTESQQVELQEGPILNKIGSAVGKGLGSVSKGLGATAGAVVGAGKAFKRGYRVGRDTVAGAGDYPGEPAPAVNAPAQGAPVPSSQATSAPTANAPASKPAAAKVKAAKTSPATPAPVATPASAAAKPTAPKAKAAAPAAPKSKAAATPATSPAASGGKIEPTLGVPPLPSSSKKAVATTAQAMKSQSATQAGQTLYAQVKANIDKLDRKGKQRILKFLQQSLAAPAAAPATKAGSARQPQTAGKINQGNMVAEGFSLFRKQ